MAYSSPSPSSAIRPSSMTMVRLWKSSTSLWSWVTTSIVVPRLLISISRLRISSARAESVKAVLADDFPDSWLPKVFTAATPENWSHFSLLVENDTTLTESGRKRITRQVDKSVLCPDAAEAALARMPEYRYLREKIYPKLRYVKFEFYMHRVGMVKDTLHTT